MGVTFEVIPFKGVCIDGRIEVFPGLDAEAVDDLLKEHRNMHYAHSYYYYESNLHIEAGEDGKISEIELSEDPSVEVRMCSVNLFECEDKELIETLSNQLNERPDMQGTADEATDVSWKHSGITLWRPVSPKKASESAEEAKENGYYEFWLKEEYEPSKFFKTILIKRSESGT